MAYDLAEQLQALYKRWGDLAGVRIELYGDLIAISVENSQAQATVFLQGAQLSHYQRNFQQENEPAIIWSSDACTHRTGQPLRGGIPVCWPWFGDLDRNPENIRKMVVKQDATNSEVEIPAHGFVRNQEWRLDHINIVNDDLTEVALTLEIDEEDEPLWPYRCSLQLTLQIGAHLKSSLKVTNNDQQSIYFTGALHSYLRVGDIANVLVDGLDGVSYIDALQDFQTFKQQGAIDFQGETDRIYYDAPAITTIQDQSLRRSITLRGEGSSSTVIWNPWIEKGRRLSCFNEDDYSSMVCVETCNAHTDFVCLEPGQSHTLAVTIDSTAIDK